MRVKEILNEFNFLPQFSNQQDVDKDEPVDVLIYGKPGKHFRAEDAWNALWELLPQEYSPSNESAQHKILEVQRYGGAVITTKPLSIAKKLVKSFKTYGIPTKIA